MVIITIMARAIITPVIAERGDELSNWRRITSSTSGPARHLSRAPRAGLATRPATAPPANATAATSTSRSHSSPMSGPAAATPTPKATHNDNLLRKRNVASGPRRQAQAGARMEPRHCGLVSQQWRRSAAASPAVMRISPRLAICHCALRLLNSISVAVAVSVCVSARHCARQTHRHSTAPIHAPSRLWLARRASRLEPRRPQCILARSLHAMKVFVYLYQCIFAACTTEKHN